MSTEGERTRARIISATARLLATSAEENVSNRAVCNASGVTPPTLYHHFGDRDGLLQAVVSDAFDRYLRNKAEVESTGDVATDLRRGWNMHVAFGVENPTLYELMYGRPPNRTKTSAAAQARAELRKFVSSIESQGRLRLPVDVTTDVLEAAAIGVTLSLIRSSQQTTPATSDVVRDALAVALIAPTSSVEHHSVTPGLTSAAEHLRAELPHGAVGSLRDVETALLHTWLDTLIHQ